MRPKRTGHPIKWPLKSATAALILASASLIDAQTIQTLCSFNNANGANPYAALTLGNDGNFYGTTCYGGVTNSTWPAGCGKVFKVTTNGMLTTLISFSGTDQPNCGANPHAALTLGNDGNFYGTTQRGGCNSMCYSNHICIVIVGGARDGTVFQVTTNGVLTTLVTCSGSTVGLNPYAGLTLGNDGNFYGTTPDDGWYHLGTVFRVTTNIPAASTPEACSTTLTRFFEQNSGANPYAALTLGNDGNFYGTTCYGGVTNSTAPAGCGKVFKVTTNGTLTALAAFNSTNGANPYAALTLGNDGNFYGTASGGGTTNSTYTSGMGTVFKVTTNGTLTRLAAFNFTNGANPQAALTLGNDGTFYGTTVAGGITNSTYRNGMGTVFRVTTNGTLTTLVAFNYTNGAKPYAALTLGNDGNFYGTASGGGSYGYGTVFRLSLSPVSPGYNRISAQLLSGGSVRLSFVGMAGTNYALDRSFSLSPANWVVLVTNPADAGGALVFTNTPDPTTNNFWRIRSVP